MSLKSRFGPAAGRPALGVFLGLPVPALVDVIGRAGFDFIILDGEHGTFSPGNREGCLRAADAVGLPAVVRVADHNPSNIQFALDAGAQGVQVPSVETAEQARSIVEASHYAPRGRRGFGSNTREAAYGFAPRIEVIRRASEETTVVIQIETRKGVERLEDILAVDGIDAVFLGTSDMSLDYGYASPGDPAMLPLLRQVVGRIRRSARACGVHLVDWKLLPEMMKCGVDFYTVASLTAIGQALQGVVSQFEEAVAR